MKQNNIIKLVNKKINEKIIVEILTGYNGLAYVYNIHRLKDRYRLYKCNDSTRLYKFISNLYNLKFKEVKQ